MADINRIKNNIRSMVDQGAPESDIDGYIDSEGVTLEELQAPSNAMPAPPPVPTVAPAPNNVIPSNNYQAGILPFSKDAQGQTQFDTGAGLLGMIKRGFAAPGDVLTGKLDPTSPEGLQRATEFAGVFTPMSAGMRGRGAISSRNQKQQVPTKKELKKAASEGYEKAKNLGVEYQSSAIQNWANKTIDELNEQSRIPETYKEVHGLLKKLANPAPNSTMSVGVINEVYKELGRLAGDPKPAKSATANYVQRSLDDFHFNIKPDDIATNATNPAEAAKILKEARGNAAAGFRSDKITDLLKSAERKTSAAGSGRNIDNQLRSRLVSFIESKKGSRGLSKAEQQAVDDVIAGKPTTNALRYFGNLMGGGGGIMSSAQQVGAGALGFSVAGVPGLALAAVPPVLGATARQIGGGQTRRGVEKLDELFRTRSPMYAQRANNPDIAATGGYALPPKLPLLPSPTQGLGRQSLLSAAARVPAARGYIMGLNNELTPYAQRDPYLLGTGQ
tara:strand:+ start:903 stop:2411 length:1509 start_codon:yes stop_codon:yes gene_type:complete